MPIRGKWEKEGRKREEKKTDGERFPMWKLFKRGLKMEDIFWGKSLFISIKL